MEVTLAGEGQGIAVLDKCVLTVFLDVPEPGQCTVFAEVCSASAEPFRVSMAAVGKLQSRHDLYLDFQSCGRLFSGYRLVDNRTGEHSQRAGEKVFDVVPTPVKVTDVAPSSAGIRGCAFHVSFAEQPAQGKYLGTWLQWTQSTPFALSGVNPKFSFSLRTERLKIETFYSFLVIPAPYRSLDPSCELVPSFSRMATGSIRNPVHEFELQPDFPVFPCWRSLILNRKVLRNRDPLTLREDGEIDVEFLADAPGYARRLNALSYLSGVTIAVTASALANCIFLYHTEGLTRFVCTSTATALVAFITAAILGWRAVRR